jgi:hypothetical protein
VGVTDATAATPPRWLHCPPGYPQHPHPVFTKTHTWLKATFIESRICMRISCGCNALLAFYIQGVVIERVFRERRTRVETWQQTTKSYILDSSTSRSADMAAAAKDPQKVMGSPRFTLAWTST